MFFYGIMSGSFPAGAGAPITGTLTLDNSTPEWGLGLGALGPVDPTSIGGTDISAFYFSNSVQEHTMHLLLNGGVKIPGISGDLIAVTWTGGPINPMILGWNGTKYVGALDATQDAYFTTDDAVRAFSIEEAVPFYTGTMTVGNNGNFGWSDGAIFAAHGNLTPLDLNGVNSSTIYTSASGGAQVSMGQTGFAQIPGIADGTLFMQMDSELPIWFEWQNPLYVCLAGTGGDYIVAQDGNAVTVNLYGAT